MEIELTQGSQEWLEFRRKYRMASETPAILGVSPYQTHNDIRKAKRGESAFVNNAMRKGVEQEPLARAQYEADFELMRPCVLINGDYGASLDGLNMDGTILLEVKTPYKGTESDRWQAAVKGEATPYDYAQIQHQLMVTGCKEAHLYIWNADEAVGLMVPVKPEPEYWERIKTAWDEFWTTLGQRDDQAWKEACRAYKLAAEVLRLAENQMELCSKALVDMAGDYAIGAGVEVKKITKQGTVDWKAVQKEHLTGVDVEAYRKEGSTYFKIDMKD